MPFSYRIFITHPIATCSFIALILCFISLWVHKRIWLWGSFLLISCMFAFLGKMIVSPKMFIFLGLLGSLHFCLSSDIKGWIRLILILGTTCLSILLLVPNFFYVHDLVILKNAFLSRGAEPYTLSLNYVFPLIGLFPLALSVPLIHSYFHLKSIAPKAFLLSVIGTGVIIAVSFYLGILQFDFKYLGFSPVWILATLFLVIIPQEAFFRGFLQKEIDQYLLTKWSGLFSIIVVSIFATLLHYGIFGDAHFLYLSFVAHLVYGTVYYITQSIESSIFCHFLFSLTHFFCLTYPALNAPRQMTFF